MNSENIEFALNQIAEGVKKVNGQHEFTIKAIESLVEINQSLIKTVQQNQTKSSQIPILDTKELEYKLGLKIAELQGVVIGQPRVNHYSKSYFFYPEGETKKALIYTGLKYLSIFLSAIVLFLTIRFIVISIEDNSNNAKYRTAIQYIYSTGKSQTREYLEGIMNDIENDSIRAEFQEKIDKCPVKLK